MGKPESVVRAYFEAVEAGDAQSVRSLFAPDAELSSAAGSVTGADGIGVMYERAFSTGASRPRPGPLVVDGERIAVQIELETDGGSARLGDFFTISDGRIQRLAIYSLAQSDIQFLNANTQAGSTK